MKIQCKQCDKNFKVFRSQIKRGRKYCSKKCEGKARSGSGNHSWKGGRIFDKDGYILILMKDHPNCNPKGYIREHRIVVERHLKRLLKRDEIVHHINGIRHDNRIENLKLFTSQTFHLKEERKNGVKIGRQKKEKFMCICGSTNYYAINMCHPCYDKKRRINI